MPRHVGAEVIERHTLIRRPFWFFHTIQECSFDIFGVIARCSAFLRSLYQSLQRHINVYRPASSPSAELEDLCSEFRPNGPPALREPVCRNNSASLDQSREAIRIGPKLLRRRSLYSCPAAGLLRPISAQRAT